MSTAPITPSVTAPAVTAPKQSGLQKFEGFLKKAGHVGAVILKDVVKYALPVASLVAIADPQLAPEVIAFNAAVKLVQSTVVTIQAKWAAEPAGANTNANKLSDVLVIVEQPIITLFSQANIAVDSSYVENLINSVVGLLNAAPASLLPASTK